MKNQTANKNIALFKTEEGEACKKTFKTILDGDKNNLAGCRPVSNSRVKVKIAARINFAGVFTDIPPYCLDEGGAVVNCAVTTNKGYPMEAVAEYREGNLIFERTDLTDRGMNNTGKKRTKSDGIFALHAAVCEAAGIEKGIKLKTGSLLPQGSGLGTSSILAAAMLKVLYTLCEKEITDNELINKVLAVEQILGSCGGWQDPCGGLYPGIKLCTSKPGMPQMVKVDKIQVKEAFLSELNRRLLITYSGIRRGAGDILRDITNRYLRGEIHNVKAFEESKSLAFHMKSCIEKGDIDIFAALLNEQSAVNRKLSPMHTNPSIGEIEERLGRYSDGMLISGAGGGGYILALLKKKYNKAEIEKVVFSGKYRKNPTIIVGDNIEPFNIEFGNIVP